MTYFYESGGRVFASLQSAIDYANFIQQISGLIVGVQKIEGGRGNE